MNRDLPQHSSAPANTEPEVGYYGLPVMHRPHWKWLVIVYFFCGGISGASAAIGAIARLTGGPSGTAIARVACYVSIVTLAPCPTLLILDLGRPGRFLNMLRAFRPSSPMSVGSWALALFGAVNTLVAALQIAIDNRGSDSGVDRVSQWRPIERQLQQRPSLVGSRHAVPCAGLNPAPSGDRFPWNRARHAVSPLRRRYATSSSTHAFEHAADLVAPLNALLGLFVAGYTGVLLAATAVPLWAKRPMLLGPLFLSSAMSSGAAAIAGFSAVCGPCNEDAEERLRTLEGISAIAEGALLATWLAALGTTARPLLESRTASTVRHGVVGMGMVLPLALAGLANHLPRPLRRQATVVASALTLAGVFALRYAVVEGGRLSADDPQATFDLTR